MLMGRKRNSEIFRAFSPARGALIPIVILSAVLNILMLAGSFFMLLVYDEVLTSRSVPTLVGLFAMVAVAYAFQASLDIIRGRALIQVGALVDKRLSGRIYDIISRYELRFGPMHGGLMPVRDVDAIRTYLSGQGPIALLDLPWVLLFLAVLFMFHWALGLTSLLGVAVLVILMIATDRLTRDRIRSVASMTNARFSLAETTRRNAEAIRALGMSEWTRRSWADISTSSLAAHDRLAEIGGKMQGVSKSFRQMLQSLMLAVGAFLVIDGDATGGIIIAGSILSARALLPVEQVIAHWKSMTAASQAWERLERVFNDIPAEIAPLSLPAPTARFQVQELAGGPPLQKPTVHNINFNLKAGEAMGVLGRSGSGKSSMIRLLAGIWPVARGSIRLDGASLDQWAPDDLGRHIGYVPQSVELFDGTVAQNIARFDPQANPDQVLAAARAADVHDMIVHLPGGYEYQLGSGGGNLSAGQKQRVALARALYGDPFLLLLDEPNSNLDLEGEAALAAAIEGARRRGAITIVVAHRHAILANIDYVMLMSDGQVRQLGRRDEVLGRLQMLNPAGSDPRIAAA
jgi:ATP-binding cassette subfamily C protein PrsD